MTKIIVKTGKIVLKQELHIPLQKMRKMGISPNEFFIVDMVNEFVTKHKEMSLCDFSEMMYMYHVQHINEQFQKLCKLGFLKFVPGDNNCKGFVDVGKNWVSNFAEELDKFEVFWRDYIELARDTENRAGNKKQARTMWDRMIKSGTTAYDLMNNYFPKYKIYIQQSGAPMMHASSYLNPQNERYKEEFNFKKKQDDKNQITGELSGRR